MINLREMNEIGGGVPPKTERGCALLAVDTVNTEKETPR